MIQKYIISLPPITKKNSQQILTNHRTGKPFIAPSRQYKKYEQAAMWYLTPKPKAPLSGRYRVATACILNPASLNLRQNMAYVEEVAE